MWDLHRASLVPPPCNILDPALMVPTMAGLGLPHAAEVDTIDPAPARAGTRSAMRYNLSVIWGWRGGLWVHHILDPVPALAGPGHIP